MVDEGIPSIEYVTEQREMGIVEILEERLSTLSLAEQRIYMAGYLDSIRHNLECLDPEGDVNSVPRTGFLGAGGALASRGPIVKDYLGGKLREIGMGEEADALQQEYERAEGESEEIGELLGYRI